MDERVPLLPRLFRALAGLLHRIGSVGAAVVRPFEYCLGVVIGTLVSWYDRLEDTDFLFHKLFQFLVISYRRFSQLLNALTRLVLPSSVRTVFAAVQHGASWLIGFFIGAVVRLAERLNIDDALFFIVQLS